MRTVRIGDTVDHWNYGKGVVVSVPHTQGEAPFEWQHDWESVVMVQFPKFDPRSGRSCVEAWVLETDLDISDVA